MSARDKDLGAGAWEKLLFDRLQIFVQQWKEYDGTEQAGAQSFLQKLLEIYEVPARPGTVFEQHPVRIPTKGKAGQVSLFGVEHVASYTTERMDMYLPRVCVWEMKSPAEKDLQKHHNQLLGYWARVQTRYMVLCNFHEIWIYDTEEEGGQLAPKLKLALEELPGRAHVLSFLRGEEPDLSARAERVTAEVARLLGRLVREVVEESPNPTADRERITKLMLECVFAMFAEDTELMPKGMFSDVMRRADESGQMDPVWTLFDDFARREPGERANRFAPYVNGPLFDRNHPKIQLSPGQVHDLYCAARDFDWQGVRPEIFGSIFEQALDAVERHELGAHFTREADIERVVGPTVIEPWRERIANLRTPKEAELAVEAMRTFHVLDPACGCGNFLYVVYREMKRLESALADKWTVLQRKVAKRRSDMRPPPPRPWFTIQQLHGIEINEFAAFLARVVLWIGEHLAKRELGLEEESLPLKNLEKNVRRADALLSEWPRPDGELAIVGNPPYLGVRKLRRELGDEYVEILFERFPANRAADYVTYWFPKALEVLRSGERAGFVCTNSIAQNESREASIDRVVAAGGTLTSAWKSYPWPGDAAVHVSIVNWVMAPYEGIRTLDGREVPSITPALGDELDMTTARTLVENQRLCFMGVTPGNKEFVLTAEQRAEILGEDPDSAGVIFPFLVGRDVNREVDQQPARFVIDFGMRSKEEAERYAGAMRYVRRHVYPVRKNNRRETYAKFWWRFVEPRVGLRDALGRLKTAIVVPCVSPRMIALRAPTTTCFDHQLMVIALSDAYHFGILQSQFHALWARARGSTLKGDLRYTNTTIFETYPFPTQRKGLYRPREIPSTTEARAVTTAAERFERERARACRERVLGLTKIHNLLEEGQLPELGVAYDALNDAVAACYGFPAGVWREGLATLRLLLDRNHELTSPP